jgi:type IX secretion system PorP/SprF family membrane protein
MKQIYIILLFLLSGFGGTLLGQQSPRFTNYLFNESAFNPAMAGVNKTEIFLFHRQQWAGLDDGAFTSQLIGAGFRPLGFLQRVGLGVLLSVDQAHIIQNGNYGLSFAYRILDGEQTPHTLSVGVLGGVISNRLSYESAQINNPFDIALFDRGVNEMVFNYGMGIAYQGPIGDKGRLFISAASNQSANDLMFDNPETGFLYGLERNLIANARFSYAINDKISVEPGVLYRRLLVNSDLQNDFVVGLRGHFMETVSAGVTYATASNSVGVVLGISLGKAKTSGAFEMPMGTGADLGMTYELGLVVRPTRLQKKEEEVVADNPKPTAKPAKRKDKEIKGEITRARLIRQLQEVEERPFNVEIEVEKTGSSTVVYYKFINLFSAYQGVPKVENFVEHLSERNEEWAKMGYQLRQTTLTSKTYENEAIMNAVVDMKYKGEFGTVNGVPYRYNNRSETINLDEDAQLTIKEREFLKLYRFVQSLRSHTDQIDINLLSNQSLFETIIEFKLEK